MRFYFNMYLNFQRIFFQFQLSPVNIGSFKGIFKGILDVVVD